VVVVVVTAEQGLRLVHEPLFHPAAIVWAGQRANTVTTVLAPRRHRFRIRMPGHRSATGHA
jgi:hypothetical protein